MALLVAARFDSRYELEEADICNIALGRANAERIVDTEENTKQAKFARENYSVTRDELLRIFPAAFAVKNIRIFEDEDYPFPLETGARAFDLLRWTTFDAVATAASAALTGIAAADAAAYLADDIIDMEVSGVGIPDGTRVVSFDNVAGTVTLDRPATDAAGGTASAMTLHIPVIKVLSVNGNKDAIYNRIGGDDNAEIVTGEVSGHDSDRDLDYLVVRVVEKVINPSRFDSLFRSALILYLAAKASIPLAGDIQKSQVLKGEFSAMLASSSTASSEERQVDEHDDYWTSRKVGGGARSRRYE